MKTAVKIPQHDLSRSHKINSIRLNSGGSLQDCPTCGRKAWAPYRREIDGIIVEGCVDAAHVGKMFEEAINWGTPSSAWHFRPEAAKVRHADLKALVEVAQ